MQPLFTLLLNYSHFLAIISVFEIIQKPDKMQRKYASQPIIKNVEMDNEKDRKSSHRISVVMDYLGNNKLETNDDFIIKNNIGENTKLTDEKQ